MIILQDNKEKIPWNFTIYGDVKSQNKVSLKTGDYTVKGFEDSFCIERKRTTGEISINLGQKYTQFKNEFERMQTFKYRFVICEFPASFVLEFPVHSNIPKYKWKYLRVNGKFLYNRLMQLSLDYNVPVFFANSSLEAQDIAISLMRDHTCP